MARPDPASWKPYSNCRPVEFVIVNSPASGVELFRTISCAVAALTITVAIELIELSTAKSPWTLAIIAMETSEWVS